MPHPADRTIVLWLTGMTLFFLVQLVPAPAFSSEVFELTIAPQQKQFFESDPVYLDIFIGNQTAQNSRIPRRPVMVKIHLQRKGDVQGYEVMIEGPGPRSEKDLLTVAPEEKKFIYRLSLPADDLTWEPGQWQAQITMAFSSPPNYKGSPYRGTLQSKWTSFQILPISQEEKFWNLYAGKRMAFELHMNGRRQVVMMLIDGTELKPVVDSTANSWEPRWSPDRVHLAYFSDKDGYQEVYVTNVETARTDKLTSFGGDKRGLSWSPDGRHLAFAGQVDEQWDIFRVAVSDQTPENLTASVGDDTSPVWSPDGSRIAFISTRNISGERSFSFGGEIFMMSTDGRDVQQMTNAESCPLLDADEAKLKALYPYSWSPDGHQLAFETGSCAVDCNTCVINVYNRNIRRLTPHKNKAVFPSWSQDGQLILFGLFWQGRTYIQIVDADGENLRAVTEGSRPFWLEETGKIGFLRREGKSWEIYTINPNGEDMKQLSRFREIFGKPDYQIYHVSVNE